MAQAAWGKAKELIRDPGIRMVLLDEINIALRQLIQLGFGLGLQKAWTTSDTVVGIRKGIRP